MGWIWDARSPPILLVGMEPGQSPRRATGQGLPKWFVCKDVDTQKPTCGWFQKKVFAWIQRKTQMQMLSTYIVFVSSYIQRGSSSAQHGEQIMKCHAVATGHKIDVLIATGTKLEYTELNWKKKNMCFIAQCYLCKLQNAYTHNKQFYTLQSRGFSNSHVWMWELDHKESWAP